MERRTNTLVLVALAIISIISRHGCDAFMGNKLSLADHTVTRSSRHCIRCSAAEEVEKQLEPVAGKSLLKAKATGIGSSAPTVVVSNDDLSTMMDTNDEWIRTRTGIGNRHILKPGETLAEHQVNAAKKALEMAGVDAADVDIVILATSSPDDMFGDAPLLASSIGAGKAVAFDLTAACSGFLFGMVTASQFLHSGAYKTALVLGSDALSRWVDWEDRNSCILFGDAAGAMVMQSSEESEGPSILGFSMHSDGGGKDSLTMVYNGESKTLPGPKGVEVTSASYAPLYMEGKDVYKFATREVPIVIKEALENAGMTADQVDWIVLHQANIRIMEIVAKRLGMPMDKVIANLDEYGNTSAASIPLCLDEAVRRGQVKKGDVIACAGFGAGLSWGAAIFRWG